ncbi:UxaA family hydrolase [Latilactobacillus sakei]|uniref:UxaA family hydrolase n=1 Tax=Latilactobacillus sakei TaxID=1599 RepID=UPI003F533690
MNQYVILNANDNVAVALQDLTAGTVISDLETPVTLQEDVKRGHKFTLQALSKNADVIKYGYPIGHVTEDVVAGQWVHTHNLATNLKDQLAYDYQPMTIPNHYQKEPERYFMGYKRDNGKVGIRNNLYIIPTVGCINPLLDIFVQQFKALHPDNGSFDNIIVLKHPYGCSQLGDDFEMTRRILVDAALQPNAGGVLVFGLGCENNQMDGMKAAIEAYEPINPDRMKFIISQEVKDELGDALDLLEELNEAAKDDHRVKCPLSDLKIGLKCGGSDGLSGVTANPLLGRLSDYIVAQGGSTVLTEVPEMFGAEQILMSRAKDQPTFEKIVELINEFKAYFESYHQPIYENPSPGNKEGGISTLEDKSLGCTQKSGTSPVCDVLQYGDKLKTNGLSLLQAPGNDLVSSSALASADCQMVLFTTGRGTPFATYVPTVKVASNSYIADKKPRWIDFDAGQLMNKSMDDLADQFIDFIIETASGRPTNNEQFGIHGIAIFKNGVTE